MTSLYLIEQDTDLADCLKRILQADGFDVTCSDSVLEAVNCPRENAFDAAVIDLNDGLVLGPDDIPAFRDRFDKTPILVAANYRTPEIAYKALGQGADDYLLKPFGTREILERVNKITGRIGINGVDVNIENLTSKIQFISNLDDILRVCLDQLAGTLHLKDCLVALKSPTDDGYRVVAGRGYTPDPVGQIVKLSKSTVEALAQNPIESERLSTDGVHEIVNELSLHGHRPFPTLMLLENPDTPDDDIAGFVLGHGAFVLEQEDLLEMERFLALVARELSFLPQRSNTEELPDTFEREGELIIPKLKRQQLINAILVEAQPYLSHEGDDFWIRLCLDEAIANAIIHGHDEPMEQPVREVLVKYQVGPMKLVFVVEDSGEGFDHKNIPDPTAEENLLNVSGRGVFLMRKIMDEVIFNDRGNCVTMVKMIDGNPMKPMVGLDDFNFLIP
jgi:serine/threonine-protein kinase RsbW